MTDDDTNAPPPESVISREPVSSAKAQEMILNNFVWPVLCTTVNGLRLSLSQVPIAHLIITTCGLFGRVVGETVSMGSLTDVLQIRSACIKAFSEGVRGVKVQPGPMPGQPMMGDQKLNS